MAREQSLDDVLAKAQQEAIDNTVEGFRDQFAWENGDSVKFMIADVRPRKDEVEAVRDDSANLLSAVPWKSGIQLNLIPLKYRSSASGRIVDIVREGEGGKLEFPCGITYRMRQYSSVKSGDIDGGFLRVYDSNNRASKVLWPTGWDMLPPHVRLAYWLEWVGGKHGIPRNDVAPGTTFYAFIKVQEGKYLVDVMHSFKNDKGKWFNTEQHIEKLHNSQDVITEFNRAIEDEWNAKQNRGTTPSSGGGSTVDGCPF